MKIKVVLHRSDFSENRVDIWSHEMYDMMIKVSVDAPP